jgi:hypothetical protein
MTIVDHLQQIQRHKEAIEEAREVEFHEQRKRHKVQVEQVKRAQRVRKRHQPPLDFLAIGDSWFKYPLNNNVPTPFNFGIAAQLESLGNPNPIVSNLAWPGQASTAVLSYKNQERIISLLEDTDQWVNGKPDAILVSMGGDDLVGDQFAIYLEYGGTTNQLSNRFQGVLDLVSASYRDLFALRDTFASNVPIFGHSYDYPLPSGVPAALILGPWLKPSLDFAQYNYADATTVARNMVDAFYDTLYGLANPPPNQPNNNFYLVDTRNTLTLDDIYPKGWSNELHPYTPGFRELAGKFVTDVHNHFPTRI